MILSRCSKEATLAVRLAALTGMRAGNLFRV